MTVVFKGSFGEFVKNMRKRVNISSKKLSKMLDKGAAYISQIENGRNKNPDYDTAHKMMQILNFKEEQIEDILYKFGIKSPKKIKEEQEIDDYWLQVEMERAQDTQYQEHLLQMQIEQYDQQQEWLKNVEIDLQNKNKDIQKELSYYIHRNLDTFTEVINNFHTMIMSMSKNKEDYDLFISMFKKDLTLLNNDGKKRIIETIAEEYKKSFKGWGEEPPF